MNTLKLITDYIDENDWRVKENSNTNYSFAGLQGHIASACISDYALNTMYKGKIAEAHKRCFFHLHDLGSAMIGYCTGWGTETLVKEGFNMDNRFVWSNPPKHFNTLLEQINNFIFTLAGEWAGAQALNSFDTYLAPFIREDNLTYDEVKKSIQNLIFNLNVKTRVQMQSPFSNISVDIVPPKDIKYRNVIVGGKELEYTYADCQKEMDMLNKALIEVMLEGDSKGKPFTFPIITYNIGVDFPWDSEIAEDIFKLGDEIGSCYYQNFISSGLNPDDVRSMCPMTPDTKVLVKSRDGIRVTDIDNIVNNMVQCNTEYETWTNDGWKKIKPIKVPKTKVYKIKLSNGAEVKFGENHLQPIMGNQVLQVKDLKENMWLPFNKKSFGTDIGDKELGFAIGAYIGDGSKHEKGITYSLCSFEKDDETELRLVNFWKRIGFDCTVTLSERNVRFVNVNGHSYDIVKKYVDGDNALTKRLTDDVFNSSIEFKQGLLEGFAATDGSRSKKRLYTSSNDLRQDMAYLLSSIGRKYLINYKDNRENRLGTNTNYRIDYPERGNYGELYKEDDNYYYYKIVKIEEVNYTGDYLYCFEVDNKDHLFMLANGLITHNCRLSLDTRELKRNTGGIFGSSDSTGSIGVVTLNLPRMAFMAKKIAMDNKTFKNILEPFDDLVDSIDKLKTKYKKEELMIKIFYVMIDYFMNLAKNSLVIKRNKVEEMYKLNMMPYTSRYLKTFKNHFNTIGVNGGHECLLNLFGYGIETEQGNKFMSEVLQHMLDNLSDYQEEYSNFYGDNSGLLFNLEATPAEGTGTRFAKHDLDDFNNEIITANGHQLPYYTNSTQLPQDYTENIFDVFENQNSLQPLYTSGTVQHIYLNEPVHNWKTSQNLIRKLFEHYKLPYVSLSPNICVCPIHGRLPKTYEYCPYDHTPEEIEELKNRGYKFQ